MDDESTSSPQTATRESGVPRSDVIAQAIERVRSRGDSTRRFAVMELPAPLFNDLCERLLSQKSVRSTADWLTGECAARGLDAPGKSSVERFSDVLFEEYQIADLRRRRGVSAEFRKAVVEGGAADVGMTATRLLAEKLDDWLMRIDEIDELDVAEIGVLSQALRQVNQTITDSGKLAAAVERLETLNKASQATIRLRDQELEIRNSKLEAEKKKAAEAVKAAEGTAKKKGATGADVVAAVKRAMGFGEDDGKSGDLRSQGTGGVAHA